MFVLQETYNLSSDQIKEILWNGHRCHARNCALLVPPGLLMCRRHWYMVPTELRRAVWSTYRVGQCDDRRPSREWLEAAKAAIEAVAAKEARWA